MTAIATLACADGCFTVRYSAAIDSDDVDDQNFLNELGVPANVARQDSSCPNCGSNVAVHWGKDDA